MLDTVIRRDEVLRIAVAYGVPARLCDADSNAAHDFDALASEVLALDSPPTRPVGDFPIKPAVTGYLPTP